jgi:hypothetical protein
MNEKKKTMKKKNQIAKQENNLKTVNIHNTLNNELY